jgi:hypothetical protein
MVPGDRIAPRVYSGSACRWPHDRVASRDNTSKGKGRRTARSWQEAELPQTARLAADYRRRDHRASAPAERVPEPRRTRDAPLNHEEACGAFAR